MDVKRFNQFLILNLIYHVLSAYNTLSPGCQLCSHNQTNCLPGNITVKISSNNNCNTDVNMSCETNLSPNLIEGFQWQRDLEKLAGKNGSILVQRITTSVTFTCTVLSPCGNFNSSSYKIVQDCKNISPAIVLWVCGFGAIVIILMFAITMKIMMKREEVQSQARRRQRQAMQSNDSSATVISYS